MATDLFGTPIGSGGYDCLTSALRAAWDEVSPREARMYALFKFRPFIDFLERWKHAESKEEQLEEILNISARENGSIETLARSTRKALQDSLSKSKHAGIVRSRWIDAYYETAHWESVKSQAAMMFVDPSVCQTCSMPMRDWHHRSYERIGSDDEYLDLIPLCADCHLSIHAINDLYKTNNLNCGTLTPKVRAIIEQEFPNWRNY